MRRLSAEFLLELVATSLQKESFNFQWQGGIWQLIMKKVEPKVQAIFFHVFCLLWLPLHREREREREREGEGDDRESPALIARAHPQHGMCGVIFFATDPEELQLESLHQQMLPQTCYVSLQEREVCSLQQQLADELSKRQTVSWINGEVVIQHVEVETFFVY